MSAHQPENKSCHRSCRFVFESFCFWPFAKEACTSGYVFIPFFCFWKGTNQINPYSMSNLVSHWDWMDASWGLTEFGVGTLAFVTGLGHLQYISDDTHPAVSFLNLLHHFVPSKVCSTDWVIVASFEDLLFLFRFYHLHITLTQGNIY